MYMQTRAAVLAVVGTMVFIVSPPVQAVDPAQQPAMTSGLEEILVTARKRAEDVQKIPVSIVSYTGEDLKEQSVRNLNDVQSAVPGLVLQQGFDDPQSLTFTLRGRKQNDVTLAVDPAVGLSVDGVYIPRTLGMQGSLVDVSRIEVLRGPQGTLYGRNTTGGAIGIYTNEPTKEYGGTIDLTAGNFGTWNTLGILNVPLTDKLAARFVVQQGGNGGYGHNAIGENLGEATSKYYRTKLRWTPTDDVTANFSGHYEANHSNGSISKLMGLSAPQPDGTPAGSIVTLETAAERGLNPFDPAVQAQTVNYLNALIAKQKASWYDNDSIQNTYSNLTRWDTSANINVNLGNDLQFRSITGASGLHRNAFTGSPIPTTIFTLKFLTDDKYYSQEFQLLGSMPTFNWIGGLYGGYEDGQDDSEMFTVPALNPGATDNNAGIRNTSLAAFGQGAWEFIPQWHLTAGARYSSDKRRSDMVALVAGICAVPAPGVNMTPPGAAQCPRSFSDTFSKATWLASVDYRITDYALVYAKVATGYRSGGQNIGGAQDIATFEPFRPESNIEYEAGMKSQFLDNTVRVNVAAYLDKYSDLQQSIAFQAPDGSIQTAVTNAAKATINGVETDVEARVLTKLTLRASGAYTDAHYDHFVDFSGDRSGEPFGVPRWIGSVSGRYEQPTSNGVLGLQLDYDWKSTYVVDGRGVDRALATQSGYGVLNARIDLKMDPWDLDIALFGRNLTAKNYLDQVAAHDQSNSLGAVLGYAGAPRTFGIELIKSFGGETRH